ncbi:response regulator [Ktedonospora formicarum]|uniref:Response regulator n=1 Tax=Ktedonospora formicarum TaxID=2778364 RepID=A0A8J3MRS4_9CHLR|nr:response regulator [Ktedonospora formicarum]GHO45295.1 response regulator [Ktedonospora formicarum]
MIQPQQHEQGRQPLVLVVDDNPAIRDMISWALELDGYEAAEAAEGQEALDWIHDSTGAGRYPAVILLDLAMPGMNGRTFLASLRQQWDAPTHFPAVIVITAGTQGPEAASLGVEQVLIKPFHVHDLLNAVRQFAAQSP